MRSRCPGEVEVEEGILEEVTLQQGRVRRVNGREEEEECFEAEGTEWMEARK